MAVSKKSESIHYTFVFKTNKSLQDKFVSKTQDNKISTLYRCVQETKSTADKDDVKDCRI